MMPQMSPMMWHLNLLLVILVLFIISINLTKSCCKKHNIKFNCEKKNLWMMS